MTEQILSEIRDLLKQPELEQRLWDVGEIAEYLHKSVSVVRQRIIHKAKGFPEPVRINGGHPLWPAKEVMAWALNQRSGKQQSRKVRDCNKPSARN